MNWLIYFFGSGLAFFTGIAFVLISLALCSVAQRAWMRVAATLFCVTGLVLIALSATPLPIWAYAVAGGATGVWLISERSPRVNFHSRRRVFRWTVATLWLVLAGFEISHQRLPQIPVTRHPIVGILGDSVTAGVSDGEETWPCLLRNTQYLEIVDLSRAGETTASALRQAMKLPETAGLVLIEIGGNDLLGDTSAAVFEQCLEKLLSQVCNPQRVVLMFELPLPPFCNEYGRVQRDLSARHQVLLIPKRVFASVITGDASTLDSVHLAPEGHRRMADIVWTLIRPAYGK